MPHPVRLFRTIADRFLAASHALFPQEASALGLREFDPLLGENDALTHRRFGALLEQTLHEVEALPDDSFTGDDWLDRRGFLAYLRTGWLFHGQLAHWRTNPQMHCDAAVSSIFHLVVHHADQLANVRPAVESRLAEFPRFLRQGAACLKKPVPLWTKLARKTCDGAATFLTEVGAQLGPLSPQPEHTARLVQDAIKALADFAAATEICEPGAANGFSVGRDAFEFLIRERLGISSSLREIEALGESLVRKLGAELAVEARKFSRRKSVAEITAEAAARWRPSAPSLMEEYARVTTETRARFEAADFVTFPQNERCRVLPVPKYLRHQFPTAAYVQPGAFAKDQTGIFWVNDLSAEQPTAEKRAAEIRQHFGLALTCAHEAYPGHHLQFVIQNRHPSKLRRLFHHAIFYEGWTLWCEKQAVELGIVNEPEARLCQLQDALWRAHRIVIDCGLHSGKLTHAAAARRLQEGVGFTAARAQGDVNWYTSSPTVPMSYLLGRLEVERLHAHHVVRGGWTLRRFNDWMLSFGALPWSWIWEASLRPGAGAK